MEKKDQGLNQLYSDDDHVIITQKSNQVSNNIFFCRDCHSVDNDNGQNQGHDTQVTMSMNICLYFSFFFCFKHVGKKNGVESIS